MSTRRVVWIGVAVLALCVLGAVWFITSFERQWYETRGEAQPPALRDPWLPAEMLLRRLGYRVGVAQEAATLDHLAPGGTLIVSGERQFHLTPARTAALFAWVDGGGHLIADAQGVGANDPILQAFDVRLTPPRVAPRKRGPAAPADSDAEAPHAPFARTLDQEPPRRTVEIPGYGRPLRMRASAWLPLYVGKVQPAWRAANTADKTGNEPNEILSFDRGRGRVTLVNGLWRFHTVGALGQDDHAEILAALIATQQRDGDVRILARLESPSLFEWLRDNALAALSSAAVLLGFWLARVVPRFGAVRPEAARERRSLIEHLRAMGRFLSRQQAGDVLLEAARARLRRLVARRGLAPLDASAPALAAALAQALGVAPAAVTRALSGPAATPDQFTAAMATLSDLDRRLNDLRTH